MIPFFAFKRRFRRGGSARRSFHQVLDQLLDGGIFILGPKVAEFEDKFAKFLGVSHVIGVNSGTDAIFLALKALDIGVGAEVITVANTATPTVSAIRLTGATPIFSDIDPLTLTIDPKSVAKLITTKTKAIIPVHLYGYPADMTAIMKLAKKHHLIVVEDACQAHGAKWRGKYIGTWGEVGAFSFYPTKNLGALGDAGAVVTKDKKLAAKIKALRNYGEVAKFDNYYEGVNSRLDELQAGILLATLPNLKPDNQARAKLAAVYTHELKGLPIILPLNLKSQVGERVWHLYVIQAPRRDELKEFLLKNGVQTMIHYPKLITEQKAYAFLKNKQLLLITKKAASQILSLPLYPELTVREVKQIAALIKKFYRLR